MGDSIPNSMDQLCLVHADLCLDSKRAESCFFKSLFTIFGPDPLRLSR
jgi:hypothetical protein